MQMIRINVFIPEALRDEARDLEINLSRCSRIAIENAVKERKSQNV